MLLRWALPQFLGGKKVGQCCEMKTEIQGDKNNAKSKRRDTKEISARSPLGDPMMSHIDIHGTGRYITGMALFG